MKRILAISMLAFIGASAVEPQWTAEDREWEAKQAAMWEENLLKARAMELNDKFEALALGLRNMGHRSGSLGHSPAIESIYRKLQDEFISTPGHATYFRDQIKEAEAKVREGEMTLSSWDNLLMAAAETLAHMPSEETVGVLLELGSDRFGDPSSPDPKDRDPTGNGPRDPFSDSSFPVPAFSAYDALIKLGIEGLPTGRGPNAEGVTWAVWWQEVRDGKSKYRFKGSDVWHPVESAAKAAPAAGDTRPERRPDLTGATPSVGNAGQPEDRPGKDRSVAKSSDPWLWPTIAAFAAVFGILGFLLLRKPAL